MYGKLLHRKMESHSCSWLLVLPGGNPPRMYAPTLVFLLCLFAAAAPVFAQEATVTDSVELEVGQLSGTALLDITDAEVILEWHQNVYLTGSPGDPAEVYFEGDAQDGGRLQYTVQDAGSVKIVVATADTIADGALTVE